MSEVSHLTCPSCKGSVIDYDGETGACYTCGTEFEVERLVDDTPRSSEHSGSSELATQPHPSNTEILTKAVEKANENTGQNYGYTMGELLEETVSIQDFAKALWGKELGVMGIPKWQTHLMKMVVAEDPIRYLGKHL